MDDGRRESPAPVVFVVFKEIVGGDLRKFRALSNDSPTGGGARDLRFRPFTVFDEGFARLFPDSRTARRRRGGAPVEVQIRVGRFWWKEADGHVHSKEAIWEPPTDVRANEGRLAVVHTYPPLRRLPPSSEGRIVLMLAKRSDNSVWPHFATESELRAGLWSQELSTAILRCLDKRRRSGNVARGYVDFASDSGFCDA